MAHEAAPEQILAYGVFFLEICHLEGANEDCQVAI